MVIDKARTEVEVAGDEAAEGVSRLELQLPHTTESVRRARRTIAAFLDPSDVPVSIVDDLLLLVSELVTNAVLHARTAMTLVVRLRRTGIRVEVHDTSHGAPVLRDYGDDAMTGRGLALVEELAESRGVERHGSGKAVWFELDA